MLAALEARRADTDAAAASYVAALLCAPDFEGTLAAMALAEHMRRDGIRAHISVKHQHGLRQQLRFANRAGAPLVVVMLRSGINPKVQLTMRRLRSSTRDNVASNTLVHHITHYIQTEAIA